MIDPALVRLRPNDHTSVAVAASAAAIRPDIKLSMRRFLISALKIAISAALLYAALRKTDFSALATRLNLFSFGWIALAIATALTQILLGALRWRIIGEACGAPLTWLRALRYNMIGSFFNQTLPSAIGGDAVKLWLVGRGSAGWLAATYSIFIDRAVGLIALALMILVCLPWSYGLIADPHGRAALALIDAIALAAGAGFLLLGWLPWPYLDRWKPLLHLRGCATKANQILFEPRRGAMIAVLSFSIHVLTALVAWCAARSIAAPVLFWQLLLLIPPIMLITMLPISIAGWGLRESTMGVAFAYAGLSAAEGINVSLLFGAVIFIVGGMGGLVWIASAEKAAKGAVPITVPDDGVTPLST